MMIDKKSQSVIAALVFIIIAIVIFAFTMLTSGGITGDVVGITGADIALERSYIDNIEITGLLGAGGKGEYSYTYFEGKKGDQKVLIKVGDGNDEVAINRDPPEEITLDSAVDQSYQDLKIAGTRRWYDAFLSDNFVTSDFYSDDYGDTLFSKSYKKYSKSYTGNILGSRITTDYQLAKDEIDSIKVGNLMGTDKEGNAYYSAKMTKQGEPQDIIIRLTDDESQITESSATTIGDIETEFVDMDPLRDGRVDRSDMDVQIIKSDYPDLHKQLMNANRVSNIGIRLDDLVRENKITSQRAEELKKATREKLTSGGEIVASPDTSDNDFLAYLGTLLGTSGPAAKTWDQRATDAGVAKKTGEKDADFHARIEAAEKIAQPLSAQNKVISYASGGKERVEKYLNAQGVLTEEVVYDNEKNIPKYSISYDENGHPKEAIRYNVDGSITRTVNFMGGSPSWDVGTTYKPSTGTWEQRATDAGLARKTGETDAQFHARIEAAEGTTGTAATPTKTWEQRATDAGLAKKTGEKDADFHARIEAAEKATEPTPEVSKFNDMTLEEYLASFVAGANPSGSVDTDQQVTAYHVINGVPMPTGAYDKFKAQIAADSALTDLTATKEQFEAIKHAYDNKVQPSIESAGGEVTKVTYTTISTSGRKETLKSYTVRKNSKTEIEVTSTYSKEIKEGERHDPNDLVTSRTTTQVFDEEGRLTSDKTQTVRMEGEEKVEDITIEEKFKYDDEGNKIFDGKIYTNVKDDKSIVTTYDADGKPKSVTVDGDADSDEAKALLESKLRNYNWGNQIKRVFTALQSGGVSKLFGLFMDDEDFAEWRDTVDEFMCNSIIGGDIECWSSKLCQAYTEMEGEGYVSVEAPSGLLEIAAHIEAERTATRGYGETGPTTEYLYKISIMVRNPEDSEEELEFNVILYGDREFKLYEEDIVLDEGDDFERRGSSMIVQYSNNYYEGICVEFKDDLRIDGGRSIERVCNDIKEYEGEPLSYGSDEEREGRAGGSGSDNGQNQAENEF